MNFTEISLLYPSEKSLSEYSERLVKPALSQSSAEQLELYYLLDLKCGDVCSFFTSDPETIKYRQLTFEDITAAPELPEILNKMLPLLGDITDLRKMSGDSFDSTESYLYSITEIELYTMLLELLKEKLLPLAPSLKSPAFTELVDRIKILTESDYYRELNEQLTALSSRVREIKSITLGVNLDSQLRPETAGVLSINSEQFKSGELIDKILRFNFKKDDMTCIAPLTPFKKNLTENQQIAMSNAINSAINDVFKSSVKSWKKIIKTYVLENTDFLIRMMPEIEFITRASELISELRSVGCQLVYPEIKPIEDKAFTAKALTNPVVALKLGGETVPNDFAFDENGMIYVVTGPNRGGKSVLTCAVGLAFAMAQLGLPICADEAVLSPCDTILTHFPTGSEDTIDKGRLGEECARLDAIFSSLSEYSLVLLDESLSSTGSFEASYIAGEVLSGFSIAGCRCIFSTHLHSLASSVDEINKNCIPKGGVAVDTLVATLENGSRSFRIVRTKPDGHSYARDIADKYGLSFDKIMKKLEKDG